ncbi:MAG TPA: hypothetical protein VKA64_08825, partial [Gammaproteobacteria bacterium]|nr:hypothetical protein [Gammaproteobacteria bacterium]
MPFSIGHMTWELSGGSGNSDPAASLGGAISGTEVDSQSATALSNITGASIRYAAGNAESDGSLAFDSGTTTLTWTEAGGSTGPTVGVSTDGRYTVWTGDGAGGQGSGYVVVDVTAANLPGSNQSDTVTIAQLANNIWDDVAKTEAVYGDTEYRCLYLANRYSDTVLDVRLWVDSQPVGADEIDIGIDPAGIGDGSSTGVAQTVADEGTPPSNVTFSRPTDYSGGVSVGDLDADQVIAVWI